MVARSSGIRINAVDEERMTETIALHANALGILCLAEATFHAIHFDFDGKVLARRYIAQADYAALKHYRAVKADSRDTMFNNRYILGAIIQRLFKIEADYGLDWRHIRRKYISSWKLAADHQIVRMTGIAIFFEAHLLPEFERRFWLTLHRQDIHISCYCSLNGRLH